MLAPTGHCTGGTVEAAPTGPDRSLIRARRLELWLILVRGGSVFLGLYLTYQTNTGPPPHASASVISWAYGLIGMLAAGNLAMYLVWRRATALASLRRLGIASLAFD